MPRRKGSTQGNGVGSLRFGTLVIPHTLYLFIYTWVGCKAGRIKFVSLRCVCVCYFWPDTLLYRKYIFILLELHF